MKIAKGQYLTETPLTKEMLMDLFVSNLPYFERKYKLAKTNEMYNRGDSWTPDEVREIENQGRNAYSIPLTASKLTYIKSEQKKAKTIWKVEAATDPQDEVKAELATLRLRDIARQNNWQYKKNEVFDSGVGICATPVQICVEKDNDYNDVIKLKIRDYRDVIWDSNAKDYERNEAVFWAVSDKIYRYQIEKDYGVKLSAGQDLLFGREKIEYFISNNKNGVQELDIINRITHYHKVLRDYWLVIIEGEVVYEAKSQKEAKKHLNAQLQPTAETRAELPPHSIVKAPREKIDRYVYTYDGILEYEEMDISKAPISLYSAFTYLNDSWTMTDLLKDPQRFLDRLIAQIDYSFGVDVKNSYEINVSKLAKGETPTTAINKLNAGNEYISVNENGAIVPIQSQGANPQWQGMAGIMQSIIEDVSGGRAFQGLQESAGESGRAILAKQQQGQLIASLFADNLNRFDKDLGEKILALEQLISKNEYVMKVHGGALDERMVEMLMNEGIYKPSEIGEGGYIKMNQDNKLSWLNNARFELVVTHETLTEADREKRFAELTMLNEMMPGIVTPEVFLEYTDISYANKNKILQAYQSRLQAEAEAIQTENAVKQAGVQQSQEKINLEKAKFLQGTIDNKNKKE